MVKSLLIFHPKRLVKKKRNGRKVQKSDHRSQLVLIASTLAERIEPDNPVLIIDAFVDASKLEEYGFIHARHAPEGRPPYQAKSQIPLTTKINSCTIRKMIFISVSRGRR